ncbi:hypothetical protein BKA70DRAFT_1230756 [Coprinopsis sp. MPI-PUGE-AT-0042]|nr:hypothetical protein BKA70DRAFT_1230756 [Coprinopsis sp. MPI-PUGE-AT-0042]
MPLLKLAMALVLGALQYPAFAKALPIIDNGNPHFHASPSPSQSQVPEGPPACRILGSRLVNFLPDLTTRLLREDFDNYLPHSHSQICREDGKQKNWLKPIEAMYDDGICEAHGNVGIVSSHLNPFARRVYGKNAGSHYHDYLGFKGMDTNGCPGSLFIFYQCSSKWTMPFGGLHYSILSPCCSTSPSQRRS